MAARKGKGRQAVRNNSGGFPAWAGILIGILIGGVLVTFAMRDSLFSKLNQPVIPQANPQATAEHASEPGAVAPASNASAPKKPQFDFYSVLPEKDVRIPDAEISAQARAEQQQKMQAQQAAAQKQEATAAAQQQPTREPNAHTPTVATQTVVAAPASAVPTPSTGSGYLLQVGAFPNSADAETMKAKLAMQGFVANVQTFTVNGQTFHRVRLGPFSSATSLEATKQRLSAAGINSIALKEGK